MSFETPTPACAMSGSRTTYPVASANTARSSRSDLVGSGTPNWYTLRNSRTTRRLASERSNSSPEQATVGLLHSWLKAHRVRVLPFGRMKFELGLPNGRLPEPLPFLAPLPSLLLLMLVLPLPCGGAVQQKTLSRALPVSTLAKCLGRGTLGRPEER